MALIEAIPRQGAPRTAGFSELAGQPPSDGCPYAPRCARVAPRCRTEQPALRPAGDGQLAACHFA